MSTNTERGHDHDTLTKLHAIWCKHGDSWGPAPLDPSDLQAWYQFSHALRSYGLRTGCPRCMRVMAAGPCVEPPKAGVVGEKGGAQ